ncbi:ParA family protein [Nonomuraea sp. NPDC049480]|uniref:ParA family protein n=1 Tax=Nonomuraea sp. NPDC049480 TaxID=3364353 RepID=UPI0037B89F5A
MAKEEDTVSVDEISVVGFTRGGDEKTAVTLAAGLALHGQRVIIPDMDPQGSVFSPVYDHFIVDTPPSPSLLSDRGQPRQA